jgi:ligand-binding sensor domain-containing protein
MTICAAMRLLGRGLAAVLLLACGAAACVEMMPSAAAEIPPGGFTRKVWQTQNGLPEQTVQAFAQTRDHYLWIGTTGGLLRFDGARLTVFDSENTPELK